MQGFYTVCNGIERRYAGICGIPLGPRRGGEELYPVHLIIPLSRPKRGQKILQALDKEDQILYSTPVRRTRPRSLERNCKIFISFWGAKFSVTSNGQNVQLPWYWQVVLSYYVSTNQECLYSMIPPIFFPYRTRKILQYYSTITHLVFFIQALG